MEHNLSGKTYVKLALAPVLWGGALTAGRIITAELPAFTLTCIRFLLAGSLLLPVLYRKEGKLPVVTGKTLLLIIITSLTGMVAFNFLLFTSLRTITAVRSSVMLAFTPAAVAILALFFFRESLTMRKTAGILLATAGAVLTVTNGDIRGVISNGLSYGDLLMLGAVLAWAGYSILIKLVLRFVTPLTLMAYGALCAVAMLIPLTLTERAWDTIFTLSLPAYASLFYLSFGAAGIAYLLYFQGIQDAGSSRAAVFLNLEPAAAIAAGMLILGETMSVPIAVGALLVIGGLYLTSSRKKRGKKGTDEA